MKKFFYGMVALSVSLFFLGCPTDSDDDPVEPTKSAAETFAEAADLAGKVDVAGNVVTLKADVQIAGTVEIPTGVTLKVPKDKTLTVAADGRLTVTGTLEGAVDEADPNVAAKIVVKGATSVTVGANVFYSATGASVTTVAVGTYIWDADADGKDASGWKELQSVSSYSLVASEATGAAAVAAGTISIDSALKNTSTGAVTIKLSGTFDARSVYTAKDGSADVKGANWDADCWQDGSVSTPKAGNYSGVYIKGLFPNALTENIAIEFKPYPGLVFYTDGKASSPTFSATALEAPTTGNHLYLAGLQRWRLYQAAANLSESAGVNFGLLLYSGAAEKTVKLHVEQAASYDVTAKRTDVLTVIVDYSDVVFPDAVDTLDVSSSYSLVASEAENAAPVAANTISIASALKNTTTGEVTIKLAGTFAAKSVYTAKDGAEDVVGANWDEDSWQDGTHSTPAAGNYSGVYISGLFPADLTQNIAIEFKPYPGLVFYTAAQQPGSPTLSTDLLTQPTKVNHLYLAGLQRWRLYENDDDLSVSAGVNFALLLYSGAADKTVKLHIEQAGSYDVTAARTDVLTVIVDYKDVVFPDADATAD
jgi:hypothetical protein